MYIEQYECYGQMTGQSYIETDYSINDLKLLIQLLLYYEPGLIQIILSFILHLNNYNKYHINSLVCLLTGININKLDTSYPNYLKYIGCKSKVNKFENIKLEIDKVIEWYENCYVFEIYEKILESTQYSIKKNKKFIEFIMKCDTSEKNLKLFNFNENYDRYTLLVLQKRIPSIKLFAEFIKNNLPIIKYYNNIINKLRQYIKYIDMISIGRKFDIVIGNPPYSNNELGGQYFIPRHIMSN
jgi:hypothetical protein